MAAVEQKPDVKIPAKAVSAEGDDVREPIRDLLRDLLPNRHR